MTSPRIYVACLSAYNNGHLHGVWLDATLDEDTLCEGTREMLSRSPIPGADEWAIHDFDGFEGAEVSEYDSFERVTRLADFVTDHGSMGVAVLAYHGGDLDEAEHAVSDSFLGTYASAAEYVEEVTASSILIPEALRPYIDWEAMARDAELSGDILTFEQCMGEVHIFSAQ